MPNLKLETYKNKATGDVYDYTDADAQGKLTAILDGTTIDSFSGVESALADKVDVVSGKGLSTNDYDNTAKGIVNNIQSNVIANTKLISESIWGESGKNKFNNTAITQTISNVDFIINNDKTVSLLNTSSAQADLNVTFTVKETGEYLCNGGISEQYGQVHLYDINTSNRPYKDSTKTEIQTNVSHGEDVAYYLEVEHKYILTMRVYNGKDVTGQIFKPMVRKADILDSTYEPYYESVKESMFPRSEQAVLGAKQLLTPNLSGYIPGGLTVTNDNGVLTINGTLASQDNITLKPRILDGNRYQYLPKGSYTFDCKGSSGSYRVYVGTTYNGSYAEWGAGSSVTFTIDDNTNSDYKLSDGSVLVGFWATIPANTYNNEKLYPLLTVAGDTDRTFVPYAMTNNELTDAVNEIEAGKIEISGNSATFNVPLIRANEHAYTYGLITFSGGLYHFWLKSSDESDVVVITKIIDANSSRTLSATYANGQLSLTFSATIYGGVMVFTSNV